MSYAVTVDTSRPEGTPELDELQRAGVIHLLGERLDAVDVLEGEAGEIVDVTDHFIGVHPEGALLKVFIDAPTLEDAEAAVEALIGDILEHCEPLAGWSIDKCEVELHLDSAKESLDAADGPGVPPSDLGVRAATHHMHRTVAAERPGPSDEDRAAMRATLRALAPQLAGIGLASLGHLTPEDVENDEEWGEEFNVAVEDAELAAGALFYSVDILLDELFEDIDTLRDSPNAAQCDGGLLQLEGLPAQFAHLYTPLFARQLVVTAVDLTARLCRLGFVQLSSVAEELLLRLLLETTEATLDIHGLLDDGAQEALNSFRESVYEDLDHEWLYQSAMDGIDQDPAAALLGISSRGVDDWFTPFNAGRPVHPYVTGSATDEE
ncbi:MULTISPECIES: hypothetical protein [unclassified Kitasatospora]|uniref:hypothetical protein n=1 Tax=unclassified Kitasatospora TaxID=2633591 RepID=UPI00071015AF|nr:MULTISPECIES: hypothetical protein [unclassified Kitasatospora]KQV04423.1 hypothetical protein ASC99_13470 [Kitasatospora sp. Root107]KRB61046.1 hypothetical protein ASE03_12025 [Kitasatospora sp. Root187]